MKVIKGANPRTRTPLFRLALMSYVLFWMVLDAFWMDGPGVTNQDNFRNPRTGPEVRGTKLYHTLTFA